MSDEQVSEEFVDGEAYSGGFNKQEVSARSVIMETWRSIRALSAVEFTNTGYWTKIPALNGSVLLDKYIPSTADVYSNAVDYFSDLLFPHYDKEMLKAENEVNAEIVKLDEKAKTDKTLNFKVERVKLKRRLFRHLSSFLNRKNYFEQGAVTE